MSTLNPMIVGDGQRNFSLILLTDTASLPPVSLFDGPPTAANPDLKKVN